MKKFFGILAVTLLVVNVLVACGGMSPTPAPPNFPTDVPNLPTDTPNNPGDTPNTPNIDNPNNPGDTPSNPGDCPTITPGDNTGNPIEDVDNGGNFGDLPTDLPQDGQLPSNQDGNFVSTVL